MSLWEWGLQAEGWLCCGVAGESDPYSTTDSSGLGLDRALGHGTGMWEPQGARTGLLRAITPLSALTFNDLYVEHKRSVCLCQKEWLHAS